MSQPENALELGKLYADRGDFIQALPHLQSASEGFYQNRDFNNYLKALNLVLRIQAEREQYEEINLAKEKIQDLVLKEGFELNAKTYYTLALCASYKGQTDTALDYLQKSLSLALATDIKEDICYAIFGMAAVYSRPNVARYQDALKEIYNLEVFFQVFSMPELKISALMLNAEILYHLKKFEEALQVLWKAYDLIKETKDTVKATYLMGFLADVHSELGEKDLARTYITLAQKSVDGKNQVRLARMISGLAQKLGTDSEQSFDLVFNEEDHFIVEKKIGKVDFKNQFILLDLMKLFVQNQGQVYSKEFLVENVWKQPYDPEVHDNKIYVTIKRLRKMIEPDYEKPKYIFRAKNGYYMSKAARVHIEH
ncbi:MAG: winged helix-turn-helix domain-containing protein [Bdellovibrionia bacterium]